MFIVQKIAVVRSAPGRRRRRQRRAAPGCRAHAHQGRRLQHLGERRHEERSVNHPRAAGRDGNGAPTREGQRCGRGSGEREPESPGSGRDGERGRGSRPARHLAASPATALLAAAGKAAPLPARAAVCSPAPRRALRPPPAPPRASPPRAWANGLREGAERGGSRGSRLRGGSGPCPPSASSGLRRWKFSPAAPVPRFPN